MQAPRVLVITTGGTIAMTPSKEGGGVSPTLTGEDLLASVPGLDAVARIEVASPLQVPSASLTLPDVAKVAALIDARLAEGEFAGAVVVQGTDTIEETAFVLECLVATDRPVVVTGAMRNPAMAGAEGPANLLSSCIVAATAGAGTGVVAVLNDEVHTARQVRKSHTGLTSAFSSAPGGPLGHVLEGQYRPLARPLGEAEKLPGLAGPLAEGTAPSVALITLGMGDDGALLASVNPDSFGGLVVAGMGAGHVPSDMAATLGALAAKMPVVLTSRIGMGPSFRETYGFVGSEIDLLGRGLIPGGAVGPLKARLLLQMLMAADKDEDAIRKAFDKL